MVGPQFRFVTLVLLVAIACCTVSPVAAESRALRHQSYDSVVQTALASHSSSTSGSGSETPTAIADSVAQNLVASHSTSDSGSGSLNTTATTIHTAASAAESESTAQHSEGPTMNMFLGPALAGVLAIVLIGAVVAFKNRMGK